MRRALSGPISAAFVSRAAQVCVRSAVIAIVRSYTRLHAVHQRKLGRSPHGGAQTNRKLYMPSIIGIDLGTTHSLAAIWRADRAVLIPNALGETLTPSCVSIDGDGSILVGRPAHDR